MTHYLFGTLDASVQRLVDSLGACERIHSRRTRCRSSTSSTWAEYSSLYCLSRSTSPLLDALPRLGVTLPATLLVA